MSVSMYRPGDASHEGQDNFDRHGWPDAGQINWEDVESAWQAWAASDQARPWRELSARWRVADDRHQVLADADDEDADEGRETRDGTGHEHQELLPDVVNDAPGHEGKGEGHRGPDHEDRAARDDQTGGTGLSAADAPAGAAHQIVAGEHHAEMEADNADGLNRDQDGADHEHGGERGHTDVDNGGHGSNGKHNHNGEHEDQRSPGHDAQGACDDPIGDTGSAQRPQVDEQRHHQLTDDPHDTQTETKDAESVHEAGDGADHEHPRPPNDDNAKDDGSEHGGDRGDGHDRAEEACEGEQRETDTTWSDTFIWSDMSTWGDVRPASHEGQIPDIAPEMEMDFEIGSDANPSPEAHSNWHDQDGPDQVVCPAPATDHWHALL